MRIPNEVIGRTKPSSEGQAYFRDSSDLAAQGFRQVAASLTGLGAEMKAREDRDKEFDATIKTADMYTRYNAAQAEVDQQLTPGDASYVERSEALWSNFSGQLLSTVDPSQRKALEAKLATTRVGVAGKVIEFDYKQKDLWYREGVDKLYQASKINLAANPSKEGLKSELDRLKVAIDQTNLSGEEKQKLYAEQGEALAGIAYRKQVEVDRVASGPIPRSASVKAAIASAAERNGIPERAGVLEKIAWIESKFKPGAKNPNSSAGGLFQQIDSNAKEFGVKNRFDADQSADGAAKFMKKNIISLTKVLGRAPTDGELYLAHQQGPGGAAKLLTAGPGELAASIVGAEAVRLNGGDPKSASAGDFVKLWTRRIDGVGTTEDAENTYSADSDPAYAAVPLETRTAIKNDVDLEFRRSQSALAQDEKDRHTEYINQVAVDAHDKKYSNEQLEKDLHSGKMDWDESEKIRNILEENVKKQTSLEESQGRLARGEPLDNKDQGNFYDNEDGNAKLGSKDANYANTVAARIAQNGSVPKDGVALLENMMMSNDPAKATFGFQTLSQWGGAHASAMNGFSDDTKNSINGFQTLQTIMTDQQAAQMIRGGNTSAEITQTEMNRANALKVYEKDDGGAKAAVNMFDEIGGKTFGTDAGVPNAAWAANEFTGWYKKMWAENYLRSGNNVDLATTMTNKTASQVWKVTEVGKPTLMMNPPENVGGVSLPLSYDWRTELVREQLGLNEDETFQIIPDKQNQVEYRNYSQNKGKSPSYAVMVFKNGAPKDIAAALPRVTFEPTASMKETEALKFQATRAKNAYDALVSERHSMYIGGGRGGVIQSEELDALVEEGRVKAEEAQRRLDAKNKPLEVPFDNSADPMSSVDPGAGLPDKAPTVGPSYDPTRDTRPAGGPPSRPILRPAKGVDTPEDKTSWRNFWKTENVTPPFDASQPFTTFAVVNDPEQINHIWQATIGAPPSKKRGMVTELINKLPKGQLPEKAKQKFSEFVNKGSAVPLIQLGLKTIDPTRIVIYDKKGDNLNIGGAYTKTGDWLFFDASSPQIFVHEVVHKAIQELQGSLSEKDKKMLSSSTELKGMDWEEAVTRFVIRKSLGNVEGELGSVSDEQSWRAWNMGGLFQDEPIDKLVNKLNKLAKEKP